MAGREAVGFLSVMAMTLTDQLRLEPYRPELADELVLMWRESFEDGVGVKDPHPIGEQQDYLKNVVARSNEVRVAFLEREMVGFIAMAPGTIAQLYVRKGFQRRGIGSKLLEWAKQRSKGSLWLYTFARNAAARAFYERHGFSIVARGHEPEWGLDDLRYEWSSDE